VYVGNVYVENLPNHVKSCVFSSFSSISIFIINCRRFFSICYKPGPDVSFSSFVGQYQDFGESAISCSFEGEEDEIYFRIRTQGSDFADRSYHIVCSAYSFTGSDLEF
jgi:hypothetical protein